MQRASRAGVPVVPVLADVASLCGESADEIGDSEIAFGE